MLNGNNISAAIDADTDALLQQYVAEMHIELNEILSYWMRNTADTVNGGFIGRIDEKNLAHPEAPKGAVMHSRILWAFSSAYAVTHNEDHLHVARVAYHYIRSNFVDTTFGGVYWSLNSDGTPLDTKKQIYALSFAIYGCSAYFEATGDASAKELAIDLYKAIEGHSFDPLACGYFEAFSCDWKVIEDLRLSAKDANEKKTMNTHLHVLEGYTALYRIWPDDGLRMRLNLLLDNFFEYFIDPKNHHLVLFFDEYWNRKGDTVSYGHDIEAAWLLLEAAEGIGYLSQIERAKAVAILIADAAAEGLDEDGGMWYEYEPEANHLVREKHWWVQAEAMVGFFNAWQLSGNSNYLQRSLNSWQYVQDHIKDHRYGEWYWGRTASGEVMSGQDKAGLWKCPYHNSRACIEIIFRLRKRTDLKV